LIAFSDGKPVSTHRASEDARERADDQVRGRLFPENAQAGGGNKKPARRVPAGAIRPIAFRHIQHP
jgi:hypothetical protein